MEFIAEFIDRVLKNEKGDLNLLGKSIKILLLFLIIRIIVGLINKLINKTLKNKKNEHLLNTKRSNTVAEVLKKLIKYILYFLGVIISLEMFNINTTSILATAGIGGIAIGFGAQSLVKDIITGFFIFFEDQYSVGDLVQIGTFQGNVEELGLRVTKLRDFSGELHIIPNSTIQIVTNKTRGPMRALVKISVAYEENIERVVSVLEGICEDIKLSNESIIEGPSVLAISNLGDYGIDITIVAKVNPGEQWNTEREIRRKVIEAFDKENIEIPYPKTVIYGGEKMNDFKICSWGHSNS